MDFFSGAKQYAKQYQLYRGGGANLADFANLL